MDANFSSEQATPGPSNPPPGETTNNNESKQETKPERKPRFRYLTDEMLEKHRRMSEASDLYQSLYEEAAYKVYGTLPAGKTTFQAATKEKGD